MWLTMLAAVVTFASYFLMCCVFFLVFATVQNSPSAQLSVGIVFVLVNWAFRSIALRKVMLQGGTTVNWTSLHVLSFWFEVMGEVFVGLAISRSDELYFFGTMLALESALFAVSTGTATLRFARLAERGDFAQAESTMHGIFMHIVAELAATTTFTMTLATLAFSPAAHMFPFASLTVDTFSRTVRVVAISFGIHLGIYLFAHGVLVVRHGISTVAVGGQLFKHRVTMLLIAGQALSVPNLIFVLTARDLGVGYRWLQE
jgi:hypothetical protein